MLVNIHPHMGGINQAAITSLLFRKRGFSIVCGAYQVPLDRYLWTSLVMYTINASVLAFTGAGLLRLLESLII